MNYVSRKELGERSNYHWHHHVGEETPYDKNAMVEEKEVGKSL